MDMGRVGVRIMLGLVMGLGSRNGVRVRNKVMVRLSIASQELEANVYFTELSND